MMSTCHHRRVSFLDFWRTSVGCQNCIIIHLNQNDECIDHSLTYHKNFNIVIQYRSTSILWTVETRCCKDFVEYQGAIAYFLRRFDVLDSRRTAGCQLHGIIVFWMQYNFPRCIYVGKTGGNELKAGSFEFIRKKYLWSIVYATRRRDCLWNEFSVFHRLWDCVGVSERISSTRIDPIIWNDHG